MSEGPLAEAVINVSAADPVGVGALAGAAGPLLLDVHSDATHNRSVLTLGGPLPEVEAATRQVVREAVDRIDLSGHRGVHPRFGAADVVPFVPLTATLDDAVAARGRLARWLGTELAVPAFLYGPERTLPEVRRHAFRSLDPDAGPLTPHPTAGASAVGARPPLVAYNVWITVPEDEDGLEGAAAAALARNIATRLRRPEVRALGLSLGPVAQVSVNLVAPGTVGPATVYDEVATAAEAAGGQVVRAELVGLVPDDVLGAIPEHRWAELDVGPDRTIGARLAR